MNTGHHALIDIINLGFDSLRDIFDDISNGITITDESSKILYVNQGFTTITGYSRDEALGNNPGMLHSGMHDKAFFKKMWSSIEKSGRWAGQVWNRHKVGHLIPEFLTITKIESNMQVFYIGVFSDISVLVEENKKKLNLALTDPLTRLPNRSFLTESFQYVVNQYERDTYETKDSSRHVAMLFIDVNQFKQINDTYGHLAGDNVLSYIAKAIKQALRSVDVAVRYGGDEFVVLLNKIKTKDEVSKICNRVFKALEKPLTYEAHDISVSISVGIAFYPSEAQDLKTLLETADKAMYYAKQHQLPFYFAKDLN